MLIKDVRTLIHAIIVALSVASTALLAIEKLLGTVDDGDGSGGADLKP